MLARMPGAVVIGVTQGHALGENRRTGDDKYRFVRFHIAMMLGWS
jgi:hypothetical protein